MKYEISREMFKQRLEERLNFAFIDLMPSGQSPVQFENSVSIHYGPGFKDQFQAKYPNKAQNIILYSLMKGDDAPMHAANELAQLGYHFVYFYKGTPEDVVLDKGLN
jgi:hypothetical protein